MANNTQKKEDSPQEKNERFADNMPPTKHSFEDFRAILAKCERDDFNYLITVLRSNLPFANTSSLESLWQKYDSDESDSRDKDLYRIGLIDEIDKQIRYFGSSNVAYFKRAITKGLHLSENSQEAGVNASEIVYDVFNKLGVKSKLGPASIETRLERLVKRVVEKEILKMDPKQLTKAFEAIGMGEADSNSILEKIKQNGKVAILPALIKILGPEITIKVVETIVISMIAQLTGAEAAKQLMKEVFRRNPWVNALGPVVWAVSGSWFAYDIQGPAFRKTVPVCLYLGIVSMRE